MSKGILTAVLKSAELKRDTEMFGRMDPFVLFIFGKKREKSKTHEDGGKKPKWNDETFKFPINDEEMLIMEVYDEENLKKNKLIGVTQIKIEQLINEKSKADPLALFYDKKEIGKLHIEFTFEDNMANKPQQQQQQQQTQPV
mmetsp:Transcript_139898/g.198146  ORF Transcript_139898/g.198146 Transcript_139898/m.198146 type:complete len:142 (-) Transcript_139898:200-625(-)